MRQAKLRHWLVQPQHRRWLLASALVVLVGAWMASGILAKTADTESQPQPTEETAPLFKVAVMERAAQQIERAVLAQAETRPNRAASIRAQTAGQVAEVLVASGQNVVQGEVLIRLPPGDRAAQLREARALVAQRNLELDAAERLSERGYQARVQLEQARAALEQAQAQLARIQQDLDYTTIRAPWAGTIDEVLVDAGDYLGVNGEALTMVDNDPLSVVAHFPQDAVDDLAIGQEAGVTLRSGETRYGQVVEVAPRSKATTRTFRVEAQIPNPDGMAAGTSAEMRIVTGMVHAHQLSPALLSLNTQGELGVKAVGADDEVVFHTIDIVQTEPEGAWVTGLPDSVRLIVRGAGFVTTGERVRVATGIPQGDRVPEPAATKTATRTETRG